jgi:glutamyl-tRNA reductase
VRAGTGVSRGAVSISAVAVDLAATLTGDLVSSRALVIGAGRIARAVAKRLAGRGVGSIVVANRSLAAAEEIARDVGGRAVGLDALPDELPEADLVVTATGAASHLMTRSMLARATRERTRGMVVLDLAVPRDVDPAAEGLASVTLCDIDEIHRIARENLDDRRRELPDAWAIVHAESERFHAWRSGLGAEPVLRALRRRAEEIRSRELARARAQSPPPGEAELARLDAVTRSLVNKLLHEATSRIRQAGGTSAGRAQLEAVRELLGFEVAAPEPLRSNRAPAA